MGTVRAKFNVDEVKWDGSPGESEAQIRLSVVTGGSAENESFFAFTPSGQINLGVVNAAASKVFDAAKAAGKAIVVDFTVEG